jgi:phosphopantothenoylcysteine decarboxylase/phosphopantothenate--cysteine ligase
MLGGKHIVLGVTGGIAAYKSAFLVREFVRAGAEVQVVMTHSATHFITPLTLSTLSKRHVMLGMFPPAGEQAAGGWTAHIDLARWADVLLIAPATAHTIARIAHGLADDFLTTLIVAFHAPIVVAPAMDADMYLNPLTQQNLLTLRESGCFVIDPESGELASGLTGPGRLPDIERLVRFIDDLLDKVHQDLRGRKVLVTAGPTFESIDPVRYIANRSSGKMGFAFANAAALRGAEVTLVSGPVHLGTPRNTRRIDVVTAQEMKSAVQTEFGKADLVIMAAAVSDFSPASPSGRKIKREEQPEDLLTLSLKRNPDILKGLGEQKTRQVLVGFALETADGVPNARKKLAAKHLDAIVLNNPEVEGAGFGSDTNIVTVVTPDGKIDPLPRMSKFDVANAVLNRVVPLLK